MLSSTEKLGSDMKKYEQANELFIPGNCGFLIRCDGHSFSKFTKGFSRPFDENFKHAMIFTMNDAVEMFNASTGYCHSDEISLIFPPMVPDKDGIIINHPFNGRMGKWATLVSSFVSVRFNYHLTTRFLELKSSYCSRVMEKVKNMSAHFDARVLVFSPENFKDMARHMIWRSLRDCHRNAVSTYARQYFPHKELMGKNSQEMIEMMKIKGFDFESIPEHEKIGMYAKREQYETVAIDPRIVHNEKEACPEKVLRSRIVNITYRATASQECIDWLFQKHLPLK